MSDSAESRKRKYTKLPASTWAEIEALWQVGGTTLAELSERFGPSTRALQNHFAKVGILKGERAASMAAAVREEVLKDELGSPDLKVARAKEIRERAYENANIVEALVMGTLEAARRDPNHVLRAASALKMLSLAAGSLEHQAERVARCDCEPARPAEGRVTTVEPFPWFASLSPARYPPYLNASQRHL